MTVALARSRLDAPDATLEELHPRRPIPSSCACGTLPALPATGSAPAG